MSTKRNNQAKKKLLIALLIVLAALVLLICSSLIIDAIEKNRAGDTDIDYDFYPADFEADIFQNAEYLELMSSEFLNYKDAGVTLGIEREDADKYGDDLEFIVEMIYDIIYADVDGYNACFSDTYYKKHSPKEAFTMQMVYDIHIERISTEKVTEGETQNYTKSIFAVEYKIYQNNGTFRRDIGDGSKKQYITITDQSGAWLIDLVSTVNQNIK